MGDWQENGATWDRAFVFIGGVGELTDDGLQMIWSQDGVECGEEDIDTLKSAWGQPVSFRTLTFLGIRLHGSLGYGPGKLEG